MKNNNFTFFMLLFAICIMAVGYAALAQEITINGTAEIDSNWDVHLEDLTLSNKTDTTTVVKSKIEDGKLTANIEVELLQPGDEATFTLNIVNDGTLKAKLNKLTVKQDDKNDTDKITDEIEWSVLGVTDGTYGTVIKPDAGDNSATATIKVVYPKTEESQELVSGYTRGAKITFEFIQVD